MPLKNVLFMLGILIGCGTASAAITFSGGWEAGITGRGNWKSIQVVSSDRFTRVTSPLRQGAYAARVEVRPGDDPISSSGERAEVLIMTDSQNNAINESEASGTQYYAFSVRLDTSWQAPAADANGAWAIVFQLHGPDVLGTSPSIAVSVYNGFHIDIHAGDLDSASKSLKWKSFSLRNHDLNLGHWVDLVLRITFAKDFSGGFAVWRRDEGATAFTADTVVNNIPTLQYKSSMGPVAAHYWKHGFYRSKQTAITNVLWLDGLTRGDTYNDVVIAAFGANAVARMSAGRVGAKDNFLRVISCQNKSFSITASESMALGIFSVNGCLVKRLNAVAGTAVIWDGCNRYGREIPAGLYFARPFASCSGQTATIVKSR